MNKENVVNPLVTAFSYYLKEKVLTPPQAENLAKLMLEIAQLHQLKSMQKTPDVAALLEIKASKAQVLKNKLDIFEQDFDLSEISELEQTLGLDLT